MKDSKYQEVNIIYKACARLNEPKKLIAHIAQKPLGISLKSVALDGIFGGVVRDSFIPLMPVLQEGQRLGFPTKGYFYHFMDGLLVQEYKIDIDICPSSFSATDSRSQRLNSNQILNQLQNALLAHWKIASNIVEHQHLIYLP